MANQLTRDEAIVGDVRVLTGGQVEKVLVGSIARTDTTAKILGVLPAGAILTELTVYGDTESNAGDAAFIQLGKVGGSGYDYLYTHDVKGINGARNPTAGVTLGPIGTEPVAVTGMYDEAGTAASTGGPWQVALRFVTKTS